MRDLSKPLIVGETNPYGGDDCYALYPSPEGCSGHRLCCLILGMTQDEYLSAFERTNLVKGKWSLKDARVNARMLCEGDLVLLGSKVCSAFEVEFRPFSIVVHEDRNLCILPHPSGLCRMWNEPGAVIKARDAVGRLLLRRHS